MNQYNQLNFSRDSKAKTIYGGFFENLIYETKPFVMLAIAAVCSQNYYATSGLAKSSIAILFVAASYILYSRLVYRGYLK